MLKFAKISSIEKMKNNFYFLIRSFLISLFFFLLLPFLSFAQSLAPIPDVGPGVCVSNCGSSTSHPFPLPIPTPSEDTIPAPSPTPLTVVNNLKTVAELDNQAIQKLNEEKYAELPPILNDAIESLTDAKDNLETNPASEKVCKDESKAILEIDRSINDHKKAASIVDRINIIGANRVNNDLKTKEEGSLLKLVKSAKKFILSGRRHTRLSTTICVAGVRG